MTTPEEPFRAPGGITAPPVFRGPDFFNPPAPRGWITLTPSITVAEEYNDNLDFTARGKIDDFITTVVPGFTLGMQRPNYQLSAGYNFAAAFYAEESDRNAVAKSQQLFIDYLLRLSPRVTLSLAELFVFDRESNVVSTSGISVGFRDSWRNTLAANLGFQATPRTILNLSGSYSLLRYEEQAETDAQDSDTYRVGVGADYQFTPRLSGLVDFGVGYLDVEREKEVITYTPLIGFAYQITQTLSGRITGGATASVGEDETTVTPAATVSVDQLFRFGSLGLGYDRSITAEAIGVTDRQTVFGALRLATLRREFQVEVSPYYTHTRNPEGSSDRDVDTFSVNLRFTYQIARNFSLTGSYVFYRQSTGRDLGDIDQNRVLLGLRYAYPINID